MLWTSNCAIQNTKTWISLNSNKKNQPMGMIENDLPGDSHFMMTSSNGNIFHVSGHFCGNSPVPGEFPAQRPVTRSFNAFFDLRLNLRLNKQSHAGDLRRHRAQYEVIVMSCEKHGLQNSATTKIDAWRLFIWNYMYWIRINAFIHVHTFGAFYQPKSVLRWYFDIY